MKTSPLGILVENAAELPPPLFIFIQCLFCTVLQSHIIVIIKHYLREKESEKLESRLSLVICFDLHNDYANSSLHNAAMIYSCSIVLRTANKSKSKQLPILLVIPILALWITDAFGKQSWMVYLSRAVRT